MVGGEPKKPAVTRILPYYSTTFAFFDGLLTGDPSPPPSWFLRLLLLPRLVLDIDSLGPDMGGNCGKLWLLERLEVVDLVGVVMSDGISASSLALLCLV
jgi:hypothetical protein